MERSRTHNHSPSERLNVSLATSGFRSTPHREHVYSILLTHEDHPTAEEVFIRVKQSMPDISMATVYNCLDALVRCGLVRQVTIERGAARFCANMRDHAHFYCDGCSRVFDVELTPPAPLSLPRGFVAESFDVVMHGRCPECSGCQTARG